MGVSVKKQMKYAIWWMFGCVAGGCFIAGQYKKYITKLQNLSDKHLQLYLLMCRWLERKQKGIRLEEYFVRRGYRSIAVYGMNYTGERLLEEMRGSRVSVLYAIDRNADEIYADTKIVTMNDEWAQVDAIVVTPVCSFREIKNQLSGKVDCPILSLEDILCDMEDRE